MGTTTEMKSSVPTMVAVTGFLASVSAFVLYVRVRTNSALWGAKGGVAFGEGARVDGGGLEARRAAAAAGPGGSSSPTQHAVPPDGRAGVWLALQARHDARHAAGHRLVVLLLPRQDGDVLAHHAVNQVVAHSLPGGVGWVGPRARWR